MKRIVSLLFFICLITMGYSEVCTIKRGTPIYITITDAIHSTDKNPTVHAVVARDVLSKDGYIAIYSGTPVTMSIEVEKAKTKGRPGQIRLGGISTVAIDNTVVNLHGGYTLTGEDLKTISYALAFGTGFIPLPGIGFAFLAIKGENVTINPDTMLFSISIANDVTINSSVKE